MVGIKGLGGLPEPKPDRPAKVRDTRAKEGAKTGKRDGVVISNEAHAAARISTALKAAQQEPDVRMDRVEAAKEAIARGDYKKPEVVAKVAERISKYLP